MTPHRRRPRAHPHRVRWVLTTLLLAVLTLAGGAATANGTAPAALAPRSLASTATAAAAPQIHRTGQRAGHVGASAPRPRTCHDGARDCWHHRAGHGTADDVARHLGAPDGHEQPRAAADPAQAPRAGTGRAYLLLHAPPPSHDALAPAPPEPAEQRGGGRQVAADSFDVPGSRRGGLPGVRGPPSGATGPTTGHPPSRSAVLASRPR
ncbi:hypothetical protein [Streptomyces sundarbansensis]